MLFHSSEVVFTDLSATADNYVEDVLGGFQFEKSKPYLLYRNKKDEARPDCPAVFGTLPRPGLRLLRALQPLAVLCKPADLCKPVDAGLMLTLCQEDCCTSLSRPCLPHLIAHKHLSRV